MNTNFRRASLMIEGCRLRLYTDLREAVNDDDTPLVRSLHARRGAIGCIRLMKALDNTKSALDATGRLDGIVHFDDHGNMSCLDCFALTVKICDRAIAALDEHAVSEAAESADREMLEPLAEWIPIIRLELQSIIDRGEGDC